MQCPPNMGSDQNSINQECKTCRDINCIDCNENFKVCNNHNNIIEIVGAIQTANLGDSITAILLWSESKNTGTFADLDLIYKTKFNNFSEADTIAKPNIIKKFKFNKGERTVKHLSSFK